MILLFYIYIIFSSCVVLAADVKDEACHVRTDLETKTYQEVGKIFPGNFIENIEGNFYVFGREIQFGDSNKIYRIKNNINLLDMNEEYLNFKRDNHLPSVSAGTEAIFDHGIFYINGKKASIHSVNIFEEGFRFVIDKDFHIFITNEGNHVSILSGQYVLCAGILKFNEQGRIVFLSNSTGHYHSSDYQLIVVSRYLHNKGMLSEDAIMNAYNTGRLTLKELFNKEIPAPEGLLVIENPSRQPLSITQGNITSHNNVEELNKEVGLARKVLDIIYYEQDQKHKEHIRLHEQHMNGQHSLHETPDSTSLENNPPSPHGDLYQKIIDIKNHYMNETQIGRSVKTRMLPHHLIGGCTNSEKTAYFSQAEERYKILKNTRPHKDLWIEIIGDDASDESTSLH